MSESETKEVSALVEREEERDRKGDGELKLTVTANAPGNRLLILSATLVPVIEKAVSSSFSFPW